ncbi:LysR substrate-binding domain-containing protein [Prosthecomicrobium hirschii]|uniref:LysR substrate-binding domain-containing protein n=1 Tax=Prosthecodimorpha hirschii TaxID=665126 RepID=UPI00221E6F7B|nr:LysR substrate-binding domain-containing protein [Prosthecomicrobium hirschii]MCW1842205.1 LysR substrate-binding domain-containing protein [Prosthecomicrobium hirschii]
MLNPLPPLQTLRAFEATGRLLSMSLAAAELNLTAGAISRQIRVLEDDLGVALFRRMTRRIVLTDEGFAFHQVVSRTLGELSRETERLRSSRGSKRLTISTSVSFASKWLGTRLHRLIARLPDVDLHLEVSDVNIDLGDRRVDAAIRYGTGTYPNTVSERILDETMSPVCSPEYRVRAGGLTVPSDLLGCTLFNEERVLHDDRALPKWEQWFATAGVVGQCRRGPTLSHGSLTIEAAIRGEGVVLGRSVLVADDIAAGRLIELFPDIRLPAGRGYDLVHRPGEHDHPLITVLRGWLRDEVREFLAATGGAKIT